MWNRAPFHSRWIWVWLVVLLVGGCAAQPNQFGQQVQRINDVSLQGEKSFSQGDLKRASRNFNRALSLSRAVDYPQGSAQQLNNLGAVALEKEDYQKARDLFTQAYNLNLEQRQWAAASINQANLASVAQQEGKWGEASGHLLTAQDAAQHSGSSPALARVYLQWASFYLDQNDLAAALDFLNRARPRATTQKLRGTYYHHRGRLSLARGNTAQALTMFSLALETDRAILDRAAMASDLLYLGEVYQTRGNLALAWDYYARAFDVYAGLGRKPQLSKCLKRLQEVNLQGRLGHSLKRFEKLARSSPS